ncbi:MAG: phosphoribosylaminoimidazolecarboxamide formyltransferase [Clostridia bacterium]|nr:phosphoribosylaminoimidazolecarboxamide formyltransferase [Clostridia bacterium]
MSATLTLRPGKWKTGWSTKTSESTEVLTMKEFELKYGCNPNQKPAKIYMKDGSDLPITILNGRPGFINFLDAFNSWQLVKEIKAALCVPAATSFKHVSPTSAAIGLPMSEDLKKACFVDDIEGLDESPIATAYARARGTDRMSSFGDWIALSDECDLTTATIIKREVSDGIIAPSYSPEALELLKTKKKGNYNIVQIDPDYVPAEQEMKDVFGVTFEQGHNNCKIDADCLTNVVTEKGLPEEAKRDLIISLITLKYTQSNSVCFVKDGQAIGVGAGQQSRIHCTRLAGSKADLWLLRQSPKVLNLPFKEEVGRPERDNAIDIYLSEWDSNVLADGKWQTLFTEQPSKYTAEEKRAYLDTMTGVCVGSDAFFPFPDNIERAHLSGVSYVAQPGGSVRDDLVIEACNEFGMSMVFTGQRLFHH